MSEVRMFDVVVAEGKDALAFLHSQFAADLMPLAVGELRWSALLSPQGRVLHVVAIWPVDPTRYLLLVPFRRGLELISMLQTFVFRRKVTLAVEMDAHICIDRGGVDCGLPGMRLRIGGAGDADLLEQDAVAACINSGLALIDTAASGKHLAHALQLDRFAAFSVKKGCYPGQEIVARTHFLGRNKRLLVQLSAANGGHLRSADAIYQGDTEIGDIACAAKDTALAVLRQLPAEDCKLLAGPDKTFITISRTFPDRA